MKKFLILISLINYFSISGQIFYVDGITGIDSNNGTTSPFKTIGRAQDAVRSYISSGSNNNVVVNIKQGTYQLDAPLNFYSTDTYQSGNNTVTYQSDIANTQPVIISGGVVLNAANGYNWINTGNNIWKVSIGELYSRQLYINGVKATRARSDNGNEFIETTNGYFSSCTDFDTWSNIKDLEIVSEVEWRQNRIPVFEKCGKQLIIEPGLWHQVHKIDLIEFKRAPVKWIENAIELIDVANEWYIDRSQQGNHILYLKTASSNPPSNVILPKVEKLIKANNVKNLKFIGLNFQYSTWNEPSIRTSKQTNKGLPNHQSDVFSTYKDENNPNETITDENHIIPGAIYFESANNIDIINNKFEHIGSSGIQFFLGCKNNNICNNEFKDVSASAISLGYHNLASVNNSLAQQDTNVQMVYDNKIANNLIDNVANEYKSSVGIFVSYARKTTIKHNELKNFPYTGISVGWGWNNHISYNGENDISYNFIDCSSQTMRDGGGIYTLSNQLKYNDALGNSKSLIHHNYIFNHRIAKGAIYLDQGTSNIDVFKNVIDANFSGSYENTQWFFRSEFCCDKIEIKDNFFKVQNYPIINTLPYNTNGLIPCSNTSTNGCSSTCTQTIINNTTFLNLEPTQLEIKNQAVRLTGCSTTP